MNNKKDYPLSTLRFLYDFKVIIDKIDYVYFGEEADALIVVKDADPTSVFYFRVLALSIERGNITYEFDYLPADPNLVKEASRVKGDAKSVSTSFERWLRVVQDFNEQRFFKSDVIDSYQQEFFQLLTLSPLEEPNKPYGFEQQLLLEQYLDSVISKADEYKTPQNAAEIEEVKKEVTSLKNSHSKLSSNKVLKRISVFLAKARAASIPYSKEILVELLKESTKKVLYGKFDPPGLLTLLSENL